MHSPLWSFFNTINDEVDQFNCLLASNGFGNRVRLTPRTSKAIAAENDKNARKVAERPKRSESDSLFPSLLNSSFFNDDDFSIVPPIDVLDHGSNYELHVSIPGVPKDKINLDFNADKNEFKISGEIPDHSSESAKLKIKERSSGSFERKITLPNTTKLDEENIKATYDNGVLVLTVPKLEKAESNTRHIMISSSEPGSSNDEVEKKSK